MISETIFNPRGCLLTLITFFLTAPAVTLQTQQLHAQQNMWSSDFRYLMEIPAIEAVESSPTHLYVLSELEGLAVFRAVGDSLQWLYTSEGMQQRGHQLHADVRFAYLYGDDSGRLTVVEPTSVLGVYSSTRLTEAPSSVRRLGNDLYLAPGSGGLHSLSLRSPDDVESEPAAVLREELDGVQVVDLESDLGSRLYILTDRQELLISERTDSPPELELNRRLRLDRTTDRLFLTENELMGSNSDGEIFLIDSDGSTTAIARVDGPVERLRIIDGELIVRTRDGQLWSGSQEDLQLMREDREAGNYFTVLNGSIWIAEYSRLLPLRQREAIAGDLQQGPAQSEAGGPLRVRPIENITIPFPRPVIIPLELQSDHDPRTVGFSRTAGAENASIRGQSLVWQPVSGQTGRHDFTIAATTEDGETATVSFTVDVRPYNTPPRFLPLPQITISVNEPFSMDITAIDPDGTNPDLIRYLGVDMPDGATLDEQTGEFTWTPTLRQAGATGFQVIATDQYGAATSTEVRIRVIETDPSVEADIDI